MKRYTIIFALLCFLMGCNSSNNHFNNQINEVNAKMILEQYFYSTNEENLRALSDKLSEEGYGINDFRSYELYGEIEWYFYSTKEVTEDQIGPENRKSENYANEYNVGYDGYGFPLE